MHTDHINLGIIVGSTREGRFGGIVGQWFAEQARRRDDLTVDYIDLAEANLPAVMLSDNDAATEAYAERIDRADAFVVVTPEYNHGYPAALKQAIDLAHAEWIAKPVGFVAYGGMAGGLRAVEQLRQVFAELHAVSIRDTVSFHFATRQFGEDGQPLEPEGPAIAAAKMLDQLSWWARGLRGARTARPFAA